jgi:hypothetical protein
MRTKIVGVAFLCVALSLVLRSQVQQTSEATWTLPHGLAVKDTGPRSYEFTVVYYSANTRGEIFQRQRLAAEYTRGLPGGEVMWRNVSLATAKGATAPFGPAQTLGYMDDFRYRNDLAETFRPDFFKKFPPTAVMERSLVWDTGMMEVFGQNYFDRLRLNEPYHAISEADTAVPGVGTFHNHDVVLEWIGDSERNGQKCALIQYQAFFNPIDFDMGAMTMKARSDYWGLIWVSLATKQIEYCTIHESVVGEIKLQGQEAAQTVNTFRSGRLEPAGTN